MKSIVASPKWIQDVLPTSINGDQKILILHSATSKAFALLLSSFFAKKELFQINRENLEEALKIFSKGIFDTIYFVSHKDDSFDKYPNEEPVLLLKILQRFSSQNRVTIKVITQNAVNVNNDKGFICPLNASLIGLTQAACKEFPNWNVFFISVDELDHETAAQIAKENGTSNPNGDPVAFSNGIRFLRRLLEMELPKASNSRFVRDGKYIIIGGAKGIGFELAKHLSKLFNSKLFLIGRSPEDTNKTKILNQLGGEAKYFQIDICDLNLLNNFFNEIGNVDGIIHSGLVLEDKTILNMDEETFLKVLNPKMLGSINLFRASAKQKVGFYLFFSSFQSFIANPGQSNYSAASTFQDAWVEFLRETYMIDARVMNWSFWGSVGVVATEQYRRRMEKLEIGSIEPEEGLEKIEDFLSSSFSQVAVIKASKNALRKLYVEFKESNDDKNSTPFSLSRLIPKFNVNDPQVQRNLELQKALEIYSRWAITQTHLPDNHIDKYDKLVNAIKNISSSETVEPNQFLNNYPELKGHVELLNHCLMNYSEVLQGKLDHMQVLFPDGSFDLVTPIYQNNPIADYFNNRVADIVREFLQNVKKNVRVLEIGAGTGSTTEKLLPLIQQYEIDYVFSDISLGFTRIAKQKWEEKYPSMKFHILDIAKEISWDDKFDIIIATNVLHATKDIRNTLKNASKLLKDQGILVVNEVTDRQDFATLTFGLTTGWWLFDDEYRIPDSPLVDGKSWEKLLNEQGFNDIGYHGSELQRVIVARLHSTKSMQEQNSKEIEKPVEQSNPPNSQNVLQSQMEDFLFQLISKVMKFSDEDLSKNTPFSEQGIDSLIVLEILKPLQKKFGYLPSTLLFEYPNIKKLAEFLIKEYPEKIPENTIQSKHQDQKNKLDDTNEHEIQSFLKSTIINVMKISPDEIQDQKSFSEYGIDSLIVLEILKPLQKKVGYLPSTLLFEFPNLSALTKYFIENHSNAFQKPPPPISIDRRKSLIFSQAHPDENLKDDIAIIGMAGKLPKAKNIHDFWNLLIQGYDGVTEIPIERWDWRQFTDETEENSSLSYTKFGAFLDNIEGFDYKFFNITPLDAEKIDPQERLFLETTYHAFEDAGYSPKKISKNTGVFVGVMNGGYGWLGIDTKEINDADSLYWSIANRISYYFDLNGPSMAIDTACSSSLSAIHLAIQSLHSKECECAVVGGVNLIVHPKQFIKLSRLHMLSKKGKCSPFGIDADGFVDGEGIISVVLKPLSKAIEDNDRIYSVIKGSSLNSGGKTSGYTIPNPSAQEELIFKALKKANVNPEDISYIEAHGTGTALGDPIEIRGLTKVFGRSRSSKLRIGSVKGNIGHLESAAGLAGLVKVSLQLYHKYLVPSINSENINPHIEPNPSFLIQHQSESWDSPLTQRIAGVSSFGAGGANAHVILQEADKKNQKVDQLIYILPVSANSNASLQKQLANIRTFLNSQTVDLYGLSYIFSCCKEHFKYRSIFIFETLDELKMQIENEFYLSKPSNYLSSNENLEESVSIFNNPNNNIAEKKKAAGEIATHYLQGTNIKWEEMFSNRKVISCPIYPFEETFCWIKNPSVGLNQLQRFQNHHIVGNQSILPAAMTFSLFAEELGDQFALSDLNWLQPIKSSIEVVSKLKNGIATIADKKNENITFVTGQESNKNFPKDISIPHINPDLSKIVFKDILYEEFTKNGYNYHTAYQKLLWVRTSENSAIGAISHDLTTPFKLDPSLIDSSMQLAITLQPFNSKVQKKGVFVPFSLRNFYYKKVEMSSLSFCSIKIVKEEKNRFVVYDIVVMNDKFEPFIYIENLTSVFVDTNQFQEEKLHEDSIETKEENDSELQFL